MLWQAWCCCWPAEKRYESAGAYLEKAHSPKYFKHQNKRVKPTIIRLLGPPLKLAGELSRVELLVKGNICANYLNKRRNTDPGNAENVSSSSTVYPKVLTLIFGLYLQSFSFKQCLSNCERHRYMERTQGNTRTLLQLL